jgi:uncharacterized RDD family membrane protein YckC
VSEKKQTIKEPLASLGDRIIAYIIDFFVMQIGALIGGILILIGWAIIRLIDIGADVDDSVYSIVLTIVGVLAFLIWMAFDVYYLVFWLVRNEGQTIGKRIKKIRIMIVEDLDTGKIRRMNKEDIGVVLLRLVFSIIDALLFGLVGIYLINSDPNRQRFADQQAKTVVILDDKE